MCTSLSVLSQTSFNTSILKLGNKLKCCQTPGLVIKLDNTTRRLYVKNISQKLSPESCKLSASFFNYHQRLSYGTTAIMSGVPGALSKQQAKDLAVRLTSEEREVLIAALKECQSNSVRAEYEVDPCSEQPETVPQPTRRDLMRVSIANAIPFIGFGFLDNFFMIIAGEHIEAYLGAIISISTMAAAALGNTISDILGIGSATYVERLAQKIGFKPPKLTPVQLDLPRSRRAANMGRVIGVTIGCILGMTPLFLLHTETKEEEKKKE
ncbi:transmembrane protein 65 isoform X2 [Cotesia typhae]|uniref:transmembrane protein 65 isoform X2 n=1 Tax=Cotesia typhae TaxID=2053667 RepID=UPI003D69BD27